jgi:hypothetical protein
MSRVRDQRGSTGNSGNIGSSGSIGNRSGSGSSGNWSGSGQMQLALALASEEILPHQTEPAKRMAKNSTWERVSGA